MAEDRPEEVELPPDPGRAKRAPPTIDLEATEVSSESRPSDAEAGPGPDADPKPSTPPRQAGGDRSRRHLGGIRRLRRRAGDRGRLADGMAGRSRGAAGAGGQSGRDRRHRLPSRQRRSQNRQARRPAPDPAAAARIEALEKSVASLRAEIAGLRAQSEKLASAVNEVKSAPRDAAAAPDLSAINERIAGLERAARAQSTEIAQENAKPVDDVPLRRVVAASLLDVLVRVGDPYPAALTAAKSLAPNPDALKPLDAFAASGVPSAPVLSRELLTLVPKLSPPAPDNSTTGSSLIDRLQAGAAKLVRIERTDAVGNDQRQCGRARHRGGAAQRLQGGAARAENAAAGRSRRRASLARQGRCARRGARGLPSIRGRRHDGARQTGAIGLRCIGSFCFCC